MVAALSGAASVGKLKELDDYLPSDSDTQTANAKLLHGFRVLQSKGLNVTIERLH